jgi:hypothetical protein
LALAIGGIYPTPSPVVNLSTQQWIKSSVRSMTKMTLSISSWNVKHIPQRLQAEFPAGVVYDVVAVDLQWIKLLE